MVVLLSLVFALLMVIDSDVVVGCSKLAGLQVRIKGIWQDSSLNLQARARLTHCDLCVKRLHMIFGKANIRVTGNQMSEESCRSWLSDWSV